MSSNKKVPKTKKVEILREHPENSRSISELSEQYGVHPNQIYKWKEQLFEGALETFSGSRKIVRRKNQKRPNGYEKNSARKKQS
jgi:transposase-like protein